MSEFLYDFKTTKYFVNAGNVHKPDDEKVMQS